MSGFKRFVSYIYLYENEEKAGNVGFAKIELRGEECRIEVHLRGTYTNNVSCKIYLFTEKGDFIQGVFIGACRIQNGKGDFIGKIKARGVNGTSVDFGQTDGLYLACEDERIFATRWTDGVNQPISARRFREWKATDEKERAGESARPQDMKKVAETTAANEEQEIVETTPAMKEQKIVEPPQTTAESRNAKMFQSIKEKKIAEPPQTTAENRNAQIIQTNEEKTAMEPAPSLAKKAAMKSAQVQPAGFQSQPAQSQPAESPQQPAQSQPAEFPQQPAQSQPTESQQQSAQSQPAEHSRTSTQPQDLSEESIHATEVPMHNIFPQFIWEEQWEKLTKNHPIVKLFSDDTISCVRIELKDLRELPKRYWYLGNNSFLLHGFFNYRYLLLGCFEREKRWFLGVPGIYQNQERVMAAIFGFPEFLTEGEAMEPVNHFGYWYRLLDE